MLPAYRNSADGVPLDEITSACDVPRFSGGIPAVCSLRPDREPERSDGFTCV
jgi:hypothetical protein